MHKSETSKILSKTSSKLSYGSANLQGFIWEDTTCLQPGSVEKMSLAQQKENICGPFQFLAVYKEEGLEADTDGILGLSPHKN